VRGGRSRPSHYLNQQLDTVWLAEYALLAYVVKRCS
jgi:hypothetical protein